MNRRMLYRLGLIAPFLFIFTAILGGAMRPGYSHARNTVSELFSPGSPNRLLLTIFHTLFALLLTAFGAGLLRFVLDRERFRKIGTSAAFLFIVVGILNILTATVFPQDPWGAQPTFAGEMHMLVSGGLSILSALSMILFGIWFKRTEMAPFLLPYSIVTVIAVFVSAGWFMINAGSQIMGIAERVTILIGFQWIVVLAIIVIKNDERRSA